MYCSHCGQELGDQDNFCAACGTPVRRPDAAEESDPPDEEHPNEATTTIAIDFDGTGDDVLEDLPKLDPGTGLFIVVRGPLAGARYVLDRNVTTIGRHPDADVLLDDVTVSRHHAEVRRSNGTLVLVDLGSLNGTYVGSHRVEEHPLSMGDQVQIGRFKLVFVSADGGSTG